jgi:hypothetical protein
MYFYVLMCYECKMIGQCGGPRYGWGLLYGTKLRVSYVTFGVYSESVMFF